VLRVPSSSTSATDPSRNGGRMDIWKWRLDRAFLWSRRSCTSQVPRHVQGYPPSQKSGLLARPGSGEAVAKARATSGRCPKGDAMLNHCCRAAVRAAVLSCCSQRVRREPADGSDPCRPGMTAPEEAILDFGRVTPTNRARSTCRPSSGSPPSPGRTWVEHPCTRRYLLPGARPAVVSRSRRLRDKEPFKTVLSGDRGDREAPDERP